MGNKAKVKAKTDKDQRTSVGSHVKTKEVSAIIYSRTIQKSAEGLERPKGKPVTPRRPPKKKEE